MMFVRMVLCGVVAEVMYAAFPVNVELFLIEGAVAQPVETHVH